MISLDLPLSAISLVAVMVLLYALATLSRRLGTVTKMKPYYRGFYIAMGAIAFSIGAALLRPPGDRSTGFVLAYYLPLTVAGVVSLFVTYRYWGWLFRERTK